MKEYVSRSAAAAEEVNNDLVAVEDTSIEQPSPPPFNMTNIGGGLRTKTAPSQQNIPTSKDVVTPNNPFPISSTSAFKAMAANQ